MKTGRRRSLFWLILILYAAASVWWLVHVPYDPQALLRAVPGSATVVTMHDNLADRWDDIADHPVAIMISSGLGMDVEEWEDLDADPGFQYILNMVGQREFLTAYVPYTGGGYEPAWVLASWIGGGSHRLRWTVPFLGIEGLERLDDVGNWPVWVYRWEDEEHSGEITLALVEGIILGCISSDPTAIATVIDAYNGTFPSIHGRDDLEEWTLKLLESPRDDRIWYKDRTEFESGTILGPGLLEFALGPSSNVQGRIILPKPEISFRQGAPVKLDGLTQLWGERPMAVTVADASGLYHIDDVARDAYVDMAMDVMRKTGGQALALGLFGGPYSGRVMGLKIPSVMAAVQIPDGIDLRSTAHMLADHWNAEHQWGVVPVLYLSGTTTVYRLEGIANNFYATLNAADQTAITVSGDWLIISSSLRALEKLIALPVADEAEARDFWVKRAEDVFQSGSSLFVGADLERVSATLKGAIAAYSLKLLFEGPSKTKAERQRLNEINAWLEILSQLGTLYINGESNGEENSVSFEAGS